MPVDFETFSKILNRPGGFREPFDIEEYIRGFQVFDKDRSGFVGKGQIKYILTNLGEKMSEEEVDELFKSTIDASNNEVDYRGTYCLKSLEMTLYDMGSRTLTIPHRVRKDDCGELDSFAVRCFYTSLHHIIHITTEACTKRVTVLGWHAHAGVGLFL